MNELQFPFVTAACPHLVGEVMSHVVEAVTRPVVAILHEEAMRHADPLHPKVTQVEVGFPQK